MTIFFGDFTCVALKLEKVGPIFSRFNPYSSLPSVCKRRQETVSMPKYSLRKQNWTVIFGIQLLENSFSFLKI